MNYQTSDLTTELSTNFIEYASAFNIDREIPNATDGLKPVMKRILYGAFIGGRTSNKSHIKCAKIAGDVMFLSSSQGFVHIWCISAFGTR